MAGELSAGFELDAFLRLNQASWPEWLAALRLLAGLREGQTRPGRAPVGAVSAVSCAAGTVLCLNACRRMRLGPWRRSGPLWVRVLSGPVRVVGDGEVFQAGAEDGRLVMVRSGPVVVELGPGSRALLVVPARGIGPAGAPPAPTTARGLVDDYLFRAGFFLDHADAVRGTRELIDRLTGALAADAAIRPGPCLDRRLRRAIDLIQEQRGWVFDLPELARHAGASERNLYYLMKRETGMTPYRFYQRCRLIRVRRRLVDCRCELPHISWYAADEGFSHLGRFAALYRQHFGELPSETVQWRRRLLQVAGSRAEAVVLS